MVLGVVPTPLVPLFMLHNGAAGGIMVTASHNPKDQNGIKLFLPFHGMKPLPSDDCDLTRNLLKQNFDAIKKFSLKGGRTNCRQKALALFQHFSLLPKNSWIDSPDTLKDLILVVDPAFGALTGIAAQIFQEAGVGKVLEVNAGKNGEVNLRSGVADLEGCPRITADMILKPTGLFHSHKAIVKLFQLGRANKKFAESGKKRIAGAIFDADGDRFFRLEYDPFQDTLWVLSGDETAILQARHLLSRFPENYTGSLYINTVESDLNASASAESMGLTPLLTAVGDKWILLKIHLAILQQKLLMAKHSPKKQKELKNKIALLQKKGVTRVGDLLSLEASIPPSQTAAKNNFAVLAVGSEETGHNITTAFLTLPNWKEVPIYFGNGLKSALNTFSATEHLAATLSPKRYIQSVRQPFLPGFKSTLYTYYIRQELFCRDSQVWRKVKRLLFQSAKQSGYSAKTRNFPDDPDMLYISLSGRKAGIFVRNSGTENKISVNLRGRKSDARKLKKIGLEILKLLFFLLKNRDSLFYKMELYVLSQIASRPVIDEELKVKNPYKSRLINEMRKQNLIQLSLEGNHLTPLGKWYINH
jgi:phosphomannomutase